MVWWNVVLNMVICGSVENVCFVVWIFNKFVGLWSGVSVVVFLIVVSILLLISIDLVKCLLLCIIWWFIVIKLFVRFKLLISLINLVIVVLWVWFLVSLISFFLLLYLYLIEGVFELRCLVKFEIILLEVVVFKMVNFKFELL